MVSVPQDDNALVTLYPFEAWRRPDANEVTIEEVVPPLEVASTKREGSKKKKEQRKSVAFVPLDEELGGVDTAVSPPPPVSGFELKEYVFTPEGSHPPSPAEMNVMEDSKKNKEQRRSVSFTVLDEQLGGVVSPPLDAPPVGLNEYVFAPKISRPPSVEMNVMESPVSPIARLRGSKKNEEQRKSVVFALADEELSLDALPPPAVALRRGTLEASYATLDQQLGNLQQHLATKVSVPEDGLPTWIDDGFGNIGEDPFDKSIAPPMWQELEKSQVRKNSVSFGVLNRLSQDTASSVPATVPPLVSPATQLGVKKKKEQRRSVSFTQLDEEHGGVPPPVVAMQDFVSIDDQQDSSTLRRCGKKSKEQRKSVVFTVLDEELGGVDAVASPPLYAPAPLMSQVALHEYVFAPEGSHPPSQRKTWRR